ncbi:hypothetical protein PLEOSDRAFT_1109878 [Pleurotus ostreatus PC15]|uniref:Cytochrome P450 n=1 Tax=Pleurotus ostreatus (strain PC15) TaxID=1137138 RepID=A0A067N747_PLEO1|nr:hypothetical protein PLEOSDRAFT_1109878 [Pleurotus ostreatus PC15]
MLVRADGPTTPNQNMDMHVWKSGQKATRAFLTSNGLKAHWPTQRAEFAQFLFDILDSPEVGIQHPHEFDATPQDLLIHSKRTMVSTVTTLVYGKRLSQYEGTEAKTYFKGTHSHPPIDLFPTPKHIPARWASWKGLCVRAKTLRDGLYSGLFTEVKQKVASGTNVGSYLGNILLNLDELEMNMDEAKAMAKVLMDAGAETPTSYLQSFVLALINFPECQRRAQQEIDEVVGTDRLPTFEDFPNLPYVNAFIKEVHRFRPVVPLGLPHSAAQDVKVGNSGLVHRHLLTYSYIRYKSYIIPASSTSLTNLWGIYHDTRKWKANGLLTAPERFMPERFLESEFGTRTDIKVDLEGSTRTSPSNQAE